MIKNLYIFSKFKNFNKRSIHNLVAALKRELGFEISSLNINFISGEEIHKINKEFLKHDFTTDIITFNYSGNKLDFDGEIFISLDDAKFNSKKYKVNLRTELTRLVIHGILHLMGYNDLTKEERNLMKKEENNLLKKYNFILLRGKSHN
ncbi:endoribonuclease YbeY [bacterium BMS3Abin03]|nr:endoribonuclease YbeY [bacterium BMS3Abin03]